MSNIEPSPDNVRSNPYVGPRFFERADSEFYYGRDHEAFELLTLLTARRLVLFYAQSGAGKTSLINARLIPSLETAQGGFEVLPIGRVGDSLTIDAEIKNKFTFNLMVSLGVKAEPEQFADLSLTDFLLDLLYTEEGWVYEKDDVELSSISAESEAEPDSEELEKLNEQNEQNGESDHQITPRALIIDQFEEIFTIHPELEAERVAFFQQLAAAMEADPFLYVMLSMREDYIAQISPYVKYMPDGFRTRYYMQRMQHDAALDAVRLPAKKMEREFSPDVPQKLVSYLRRIRATTSRTAVSETQLGLYIEPVQLQVVCLQLWQSVQAQPGEKITMQDVNRAAQDLAGAQADKDPLAAFIDTALAGYYTQAIKAILDHPDVDVGEYELRDWFSQELIKTGGIRNLVPRGIEETEGLPDTVVRLLDEKHHLIRNDMRGGRPFVELIHDSFVNPILQANRQWRAKQTQSIHWLSAAYKYADRPDPGLLLSGDALLQAHQQAQITKGLPKEAVDFLAACDEAQNKKNFLESQKRTKNLYLVVGVLFLAVLIAIGTTIFAFDEKATADIASTRAIDEKATAEYAKATADIASTRAIDEKVTAEYAGETAVAALATAEAEGERADKAAKDAEIQRMIAESLRLAVISQEFQKDNNHDTGLLLAVEAFNRASSILKNKEADPIEQNVIQDAAHAALLTLLNQQEYNPDDMFFQSDLESIALNELRLFTPTTNTLWAYNQSEPITVSISANIELVTLSPDGKTIILVNKDNKIARIDGQHLQLITDTLTLPVENLRFQELPDKNSAKSVASNPDGNQLAIASCSDSDDGNNRDKCQISLLAWGLNSQPTIMPESCPFKSPLNVKSLLFLGSNPAKAEIVWITEANEFNKQSMFFGDFFDPDCEPEQISIPANHSIETMTYLPVDDPNSSGLLITAGTDFTFDFSDIYDGSMQWWRVRSLDDPTQIYQLGSPLSANTVINDVQAITNPPAILTFDQNNEITWYNANFNQWPEIACQIAERNLKFDEWKSAFPTNTLKDPEKLTCSQYEGTAFGLHPSFVENKLDEAITNIEECNANSIRYARLFFDDAGKYAQATYGTHMLPATDFNSWSINVLLQYLLEDSRGNSLNCTAILSSQYKTKTTRVLNRVLLQRIITDIHAAEAKINQTQPVDETNSTDESEAGTLLNTLDHIVQTIDDTNFNAELQDQLNNKLLSLYIKLCFAGDDNEPCPQIIDFAQQNIEIDTPIETTTYAQQLWRFEGQAEEMILITMNAAEASNLDANLYLFDAEGTLIERDDNGGDGQNLFMFTKLPENGTYFIHTSGMQQSDGVYTLTLAKEIPTIASGESISAEGIHVWKYASGAGDMISIQMNPEDAPLYPSVELYDDQGEHFAGAENDELGLPAELNTPLLPDSDTYYIIARDNSGTSGKYSLNVDTIDVSEISDMPITTTTVENSIWKFNIESSSLISVTMHPEENFYAYLELQDDNGEYITDSYNYSYGDPAQITNYLLPESGTYYLVTKDEIGSASPYTLSANIQAANEFGTETITQTVTSDSLWKFNGTADSVVSISLDPKDEYLAPILELYDAEGNYLTVAYGYGESAEISAFELPATGWYYILARDDYGEPGEFVLSIETAESIEIDAEPITTTISDNRFWQFSGDAGNIISITMNPEDVSLEPSLILHNDNGWELTAGSSTDEGQPAHIAAYVLPESGFYYLKTRGNNVISDTYSLAINTIDAIELDDLPVNTDTTDNPVWQFKNGEAGSIISIKMETEDESLSPQLKLYDEQGELIATGDNNGTGTASQIAAVILPEIGLYTITTQDESGRSADHVLTVAPVEASEIGNEPVIGTTIDNPVWKFDGISGSFISVTLKTEVEDIYPVVKIQNDKGETLSTGSSFGNGESAIITQQFLVEDGWYYIFPSADSGAEEAYTLAIETIEVLEIDDEPVTGTTDDNSIWKFSLDSGSNISITMSSENEDLYPYIELFNNKGESLTSAYGYGEPAQISRIFLPPSDWYYLIAKDEYDFSGEYTLVLETEGAQEMEEQVVTGTTDENALWRFNIQGNNIFAITMNSENDELYPYFELFNNNGEYLNTGYASGADQSAQIVAFVQPETSAYYINALSDYGTSGEYTLTVEPQEATEIDNEPVTGTTENISVYQFKGEGGSFVSITMQPNNRNLYPYLAIYSENGTRLDTGYSNEEGQPAKISALGIPKSGSIYIIARDQNGAIGEYTLAVESVAANEIGDEPEISTTTEKSLWRFMGSAGDRVTIDLESSSDLFDPELTLVGPDGEALEYDDDDGEGPRGFDARIQNYILEEDGIYYIIAGRPSSDVEYTLTLQIR